MEVVQVDDLPTIADINHLDFAQRRQVFHEVVGPIDQLPAKPWAKDLTEPVYRLIATVPWYYPTSPTLPSKDWIAFEQPTRWPRWDMDYYSPANQIPRATSSPAHILENVCESVQAVVAKAIFLNMNHKPLAEFTRGASAESMAELMLHVAFRMQDINQVIESFHKEPREVLRDFLNSRNYPYGAKGKDRNSPNNPLFQRGRQSHYYFTGPYSPLGWLVIWLKAVLWIRLYYRYIRYPSVDPDSWPHVETFIEPLTQFGLAFSYGHIPVAMVDGKLWLVQRIGE